MCVSFYLDSAACSVDSKVVSPIHWCTITTDLMIVISDSMNHMMMSQAAGMTVSTKKASFKNTANDGMLLQLTICSILLPSYFIYLTSISHMYTNLI